jgi:hypothetical protein
MLAGDRHRLFLQAKRLYSSLVSEPRQPYKESSEKHIGTSGIFSMRFSIAFGDLLPAPAASSRRSALRCLSWASTLAAMPSRLVSYKGPQDAHIRVCR